MPRCSSAVVNNNENTMPHRSIPDEGQGVIGLVLMEKSPVVAASYEPV